jgi:hypothetical protein
MSDPYSKFNYISKSNGAIVDALWPILDDIKWENFYPENLYTNHIENLVNSVQEKPLLFDFIPLRRNMYFDSVEQKITYKLPKPKIRKTSKEDFLFAAEIFFKRYKDKHIGVQLSGGLDSSLIICLLSYFEIPFSLVGMISNRFEFRTERFIQNKLKDLSINTRLINYDEYLPFNKLKEIPKFQYPDLSCINFSCDLAMANATKELGIDVLFSGEGGDFLFCQKISSQDTEYPWNSASFYDQWLNENAYLPSGCELVPFYADEGIMNCIYNLRCNQPNDWSKLWARMFFKDFLPNELSEYTYYADFWGLYLRGLLTNKSVIKELLDEAFIISKKSFFNPKDTDDILSQNYLSLNRNHFSKLEAVVSAAVWLNSFANN